MDDSSPTPGPGPTLVLLHGLGATAAVWNRFISAARWRGPVVAPDLRGHGSAAWTNNYSFAAMASDVAAELDGPYVVLGHSLGGVVGLELASGRHGPAPVGTATIGVKIRWSDEELARLPGLAERPSRRFDDEAEATDWFLKLAGLFGVVDSSDPLAPTGVVNESHPEGDWRAAQDPATVLVGAPDLASLLSEAKTSVSMALGDADPLVSPDHHNDIVGPTPHVFAGVGHNAMVEDPEPVARWFVQLDFVKAALAG